MTPRLRRLAADQQEMNSAFAAHRRIRIISSEGTPPERYLIQFAVAGLRQDDQGEPQLIKSHQAEVFLPLDYPRRPPICRMHTAVFHPNIDPQKICVGDHWSAGETLSELVLRIAEMISFQSYNTRSPLNAGAAKWADENAASLPLQATDLREG